MEDSYVSARTGGQGAATTKQVRAAGAVSSCQPIDVGAETLEPIPVIDLSRLSTAGGADDDESGKLRLALQTWGLFLVANHGIETDLMDDLMEA